MEITAKLAMAATSSMACALRKFTCSNGVQLVGQLYTNNNNNGGSKLNHDSSFCTAPKKILMLHGWLDNCRTFWTLAPTLASKEEENVEILALDLPGHGQSQHSPEVPIVMADALFYIHQVLEQMDWIDSSTSSIASNNNDDDTKNKVVLIGHSMGAALSVLFAATFDRYVESVILLDGVGPFPRDESETVSQLKSHYQKRLRFKPSTHGANMNRIYSNIDQAIAARRSSASGILSMEAATELVSWATTTKPKEKTTTTKQQQQDTRVQFRHDVRLYWPSIQSFTPRQVQQLQKAVKCPTLLLLANKSFLLRTLVEKTTTTKKDETTSNKNKEETSSEEEKNIAAVKAYLTNHFGNLQQVEILEGYHHFHADPDTAPLVARHVQTFLFP